MPFCTTEYTQFCYNNCLCDCTLHLYFTLNNIRFMVWCLCDLNQKYWNRCRNYRLLFSPLFFFMCIILVDFSMLCDGSVKIITIINFFLCFVLYPLFLKQLVPSRVNSVCSAEKFREVCVLWWEGQKKNPQQSQ